MCLILIAHHAHPDMPLVVAANRDEFYARPSASAHFWHGEGTMLAGKDLEAGGTWLGVDERGRFAAVTNVSEPPPEVPKASRGALVQDFLSSSRSAQDYVQDIEGAQYRGFNLLLWDNEQLLYTSNRDETKVLPPGVYGLANQTLDEDRHRVERGKGALADALDNYESWPSLSERLMELLGDRMRPATPEVRNIPDRSPEEIAALGACFIVGSDFGTRASTAVAIRAGQVHFAEQLFSSGGLARGHSQHHFARR